MDKAVSKLVSISTGVRKNVFLDTAIAGLRSQVVRCILVTHPLDGLLHHMFSIANSLTVEAERNVATDTISTGAGAFARACGVRHSEQCATMRIAGSVCTVLRPTQTAKVSLASRTDGTDPRTGKLKRANDERRRARNSWT